MNVSGVCSTTSTQNTAANDGFGQLFSDFKSIASTIQSGDLSSAQTALTTFEQDLQNNTGKNPLSQLFKNNGTLSKDLDAVQTALKSNDPAAAQSAFKTLGEDMQTAMKTHRSHGRHHHHPEVGADTQAEGDIQSSTGSAAGVGSTLDVQA